MVLASAQLQSEVISWTMDTLTLPTISCSHGISLRMKVGLLIKLILDTFVICELVVILIDNFGSLLFFLLPKEDRWSPKEPSSGVKIRKYLLHEGPLSYIMSYTN